MRGVERQDTRFTSDVGEIREISYVEKALALGLLLILLSCCILVLYPFLSAILLSIPLCVSTWPLFTRVQRWLGGRRTPAALVMTIAIASLLVVPLIFLGVNLADDVTRLNDAVRSAIGSGLPPPRWLGTVPILGHEGERIWLEITREGAQLRVTLSPYLGPLRGWVLQQGASLLGGTVQVLLSIILLFFLFRDGANAENRLEAAMARVGGWRAQHVLQSAATTIRSVVNGVVGTALIQGILLGLSFSVAGLPGAQVLGALAVILSLMPLGLIVLWLPAGIWLLAQGETGWGIFVLAWNGLLVGTLDNVLRPYLISRGAPLPTVLIFLGVLGGLVAFGIVGVFLGPVLLAVAYTLFQDWDVSRDSPMTAAVEN